MIVDVWVDRGLPWLPLLGFLAVGCVNLDKPNQVQACSARGTCSNEPSTSEDARRDVKSPLADLASDQDGKQDVGLGGEKPDLAPDPAPDLASPDLGKDGAPSDPFSGSEDVVPDKAPATEPANGPELGPEASMRPEPGPEASMGPEPGPDAGRDTAPESPPDAASSDVPAASGCTIFYGTDPPTGSAGQPPIAGTLNAFCIATCDDIVGWGCSNFDGRTITVNGATVSCAATVTKKNGYYVFRASAGTLSYASIYWWGTRASTCPAPADGVFP